MTEAEALLHEIICNQIELLEMQAAKLEEAATEVRSYAETLRCTAATLAYDNPESRVPSPESRVPSPETMMSSKNRRPRKVPNPPKILTSSKGAGPARLREAIRNARQMVGCLKKGDEDAIAQATLIQGILSGDVVAASIHARQRLQRENYRLRSRIGMQRLRTERAKQRLLELEIDIRERPAVTSEQLMTRVYEIYGLRPPQLLPASTIDAETT